MTYSSIHRYLRHGTLPQLRLFEASARLGSLTRAAEELHLAQPTASVQIKKLTETVGVPLFEHVGKRIYLTDAGRRVYECCQGLFRSLAALEDSLTAMRSLEAGALRLAVSTTSTGFASRLVGAFVRIHSAVEPSLQACNRKGLLIRLAANEDDLYLFAERPEPDDIVSQELLPNPLVVLARDDHPLANSRDIPFARLADEPFLVREEGSGARRTALRLFADHRLVPKIRMELGSNEAIKEAILAGLGIAITARHTFGLDPESSRYACLDVQGFPIENHWYLAYPQGKQLSPVAKAFLDFARVETQRLLHEFFVAARSAPRSD